MVLKTILVLGCSLLAGALTCHASITIADWTFEATAPSTAGPLFPEQGTGSALGWHASSDAVYSNPVGNGSGESFSANNWAVGDYWQFQVSTLGFTGISLSWDQASSNTGPRDYGLYYSTDGTVFNQFNSDLFVLANASPNSTWSSSTTHSEYSFSQDLGSIVGLNNAESVWFRLVNKSTVSANGGSTGTGGTDRIDNFIVSATSVAVAVPEPSTFIAGALLLLPFGVGSVRFLRNRKHG